MRLTHIGPLGRRRSAGRCLPYGATAANAIMKFLARSSRKDLAIGAGQAQIVMTADPAGQPLNPHREHGTSSIPPWLPSILLAIRSAAAPAFRRHAMSQQKHLNHGPRREDLDHGAGLRLDLDAGFADLDAGDSLDVPPQRLGTTVE